MLHDINGGDRKRHGSLNKAGALFFHGVLESIYGTGMMNDTLLLPMFEHQAALDIQVDITVYRRFMAFARAYEFRGLLVVRQENRCRLGHRLALEGLLRPTARFLDSEESSPLYLVVALAIMPANFEDGTPTLNGLER